MNIEKQVEEIQKRIELAEKTDEFYGEIDLEVYDEEFERL